MKSCFECVIYSEVKDKFVLENSDNESSLHYCSYFPSGIPKDIWKDPNKCDGRIKRNI